jgi:hypothetical protein
MDRYGTLNSPTDQLASRRSERTMAKTCIICGKAAGSQEHVFPAVLGGRRTNKGIEPARRAPTEDV